MARRQYLAAEHLAPPAVLEARRREWPQLEQRTYRQPGRPRWWVWVDPWDPTAGAVPWRPWRPAHWRAAWHDRRTRRRWFG